MSTRLQPSPVAPSVDELVPLFEEALRDPDDSERALKAGHLNAIIGQLSQSADPAALAPALQSLLSREDAKRLLDGQGTSVRIAATQAMLSLSYPHPLEVAPEHLEALRLQRASVAPPAPKGRMFTVLALATLLQAVSFVLADDTRLMLHGLTADQLAGGAGLHPPPVDGFLDRLEMVAWWPVRPLVPWVQVFGAAALYYFATTVATTVWDRTLVRRAFLGLGVLGLVWGVLPMHVYENCGTLVSALGSLLAGWLLRTPKPSGSDVPPAA
ncbi:hypothetical protein [Corallococcus sp. EGB]|uniref:hypothetical protein n=1 Tax=Corallococcus sp. EGB TaxID=1521117 RepID=UPI001CBFFFF5|nr:hypothetical protein [Corallococcus sp. EGB]